MRCHALRKFALPLAWQHLAVARWRTRPRDDSLHAKNTEIDTIAAAQIAEEDTAPRDTTGQIEELGSTASAIEPSLATKYRWLAEERARRPLATDGEIKAAVDHRVRRGRLAGRSSRSGKRRPPSQSGGVLSGPAINADESGC